MCFVYCWHEQGAIAEMPLPVLESLNTAEELSNSTGTNWREECNEVPKVQSCSENSYDRLQEEIKKGFA